MLLTILFAMVLFVVAFGLRAPFSPRRAATAAGVGLFAGLAAAYFNVYPGSIRGALGLLGFALIVSGARVARRYTEDSDPLHRWMPRAGAILVVAMLLLGLFPYTAWGAGSVDEKLYQDLNGNPVKDAAPALVDPDDVRVVPWDLASQLLVRGYAEDASYLDSNPFRLQRNTYPDTVRGEFLWVHAPAPELAKWMMGGRLADKVVYVHNDAANLTTAVKEGELKVHIDAMWWQNRVGRYAEEHGELRYVLQDVALQLDDDYKPHWIAYLARVDLRGQPHLEKLLVIDANTGEERQYAPGEAPDWIEIVYPETYVYAWADYWGKHREGFVYRWFNAQGLVEPDDVTVRYIRLENQTYWLLPMVQLKAHNLGGYILVNTKTGAATFYDRFDRALVDYETATAQLQAIMASGAATSGAGSIRLAISEGYLYPIRMADGSVRDAYVFPLLEGLKVARIAIIDARDYNVYRVFAPNIGEALRQFSALSGAGAGNGLPPLPVDNATATLMRVRDGVAGADGRAIVDLDGKLYAVTRDDLAAGERLDAQREYDELTLAIARAARGQEVDVEVRLAEGRVVDVTLPGAAWG